MQRRNLLEINDASRSHEFGPQQTHQIWTAGKDRRVTVFRIQELHSFGFGRWTSIFKRLHAFAPFNASRTRFGVIGRTGTRTPTALATAFEIAAPGEMTGGSPN